MSRRVWLRSYSCGYGCVCHAPKSSVCQLTVAGPTSVPDGIVCSAHRGRNHGNGAGWGVTNFTGLCPTKYRGDLGQLPAIYLIFKQMAGRPLGAINGDKWSLYSAVIPRFSGCDPGIILGNKQMADKRVGLVNQINCWQWS